MQAELKATTALTKDAVERAKGAEIELAQLRAERERDMRAGRGSSIWATPEPEPEPDKAPLIQILSDPSEYPVIYYSPNFTDQKAARASQ